MEDFSFDPYDHFPFLTNRVGRLLAGRVVDECKARGYNIPASCIGVLADLWQEDGVSQKSLAINLVKNKSSVTKMLDLLEDYNLVKRVAQESDRRIKLIYLTEDGIAFERFVSECAEKLEIASTPTVTEEEVKIAKKVLMTMYKELIGQSKSISTLSKSKSNVTHDPI